MKIAVLSALAVAGAIGVAFSDPCNLDETKATLMANATIADELTTAAAKCKTDTGVDIFAITAFPTKETALKFQQSDKGCNTAINLVTSNANINTRCTIELNGTVVVYGDLVSDFLAGKTGNESDSGSGSVEVPSESASGSESESESGSSSTASTNSTTTSDAATPALSFVMYGAIAAIAVALR